VEVVFLEEVVEEGRRQKTKGSQLGVTKSKISPFPPSPITDALVGTPLYRWVERLLLD
jgi:hypothetical protein